MRYRHLLLSVSLLAIGCDHIPDQGAQNIPNAKSLMHVAAASRAAGNLSSAAELYRQQAQNDPQSVEALLELASVQRQEKNPARAVETLREARNRQPENTRVLAALGAALIASGQAGEASSVYEQAVTLEPHNAPLLSGRGVALDTLGRHAEAQRSYREALALDPGNIGVQNNLALSYTLSGRYGDAIPLLERLAESGKATPTMRQNLALAYGLKGDTGRAMELGLKDLPTEEARENLRFYEYYQAQRGSAAQPVPFAAEQEGEQDRLLADAPPAPPPPAMVEIDIPHGEEAIAAAQAPADEGALAPAAGPAESVPPVIETMAEETVAVEQRQIHEEAAEPAYFSPALGEASSIEEEAYAVPPVQASIDEAPPPAESDISAARAPEEPTEETEEPIAFSPALGEASGEIEDAPTRYVPDKTYVAPPAPVSAAEPPAALPVTEDDISAIEDAPVEPAPSYEEEREVPPMADVAAANAEPEEVEYSADGETDITAEEMNALAPAAGGVQAEELPPSEEETQARLAAEEEAAALHERALQEALLAEQAESGMVSPEDEEQLKEALLAEHTPLAAEEGSEEEASVPETESLPEAAERIEQERLGGEEPSLSPAAGIMSGDEGEESQPVKLLDGADYAPAPASHTGAAATFRE